MEGGDAAFRTQVQRFGQLDAIHEAQLLAMIRLKARVALRSEIPDEDVRRAAPGWAPRELDAATTDALWKVVGTTLRAIAQRSPVGIDVAPRMARASGT